MSQREPTSASRSVFDKVAGVAKELVGSVTGNHDLMEEGDLQQRKAETAKAATLQEIEAEQAEAEARVKAEQAATRVEQQRLEAETAQRERELRLERERAVAEAAVARDAARDEHEIERARAADQRAIASREQATTVDLIEGATEAAALELEAKRAEDAAEALRGAQRRLDER